MIVRGGKAVLPGLNEPVRADIRVANGKIVEIGIALDDGEVVDADGLLIIPGGIDPHVHFDEPGYTHREDFFHGSSAAASSGITTVIDMPCTSVPPVTNLENLRRKLDVISKRAVVDYGLFGGVSRQSFDEAFPKNMRDLASQILGFKTYFISGMKSFERLDHYRFEKVLKVARELHLPLLLHAEDFDYVDAATEDIRPYRDGPLAYYDSRPEAAEILAVESAVEMAENVGAELHIVHLATPRAAEFVGRGKISGETAPHYLAFDLRDFERMGSALKTTPPVKSPGSAERLWRMLADGKIAFVASDHAPCPPEDKSTGSIWSDYSGIPGTGTLLPYMLSEGYLAGRLSLSRFVEVVSSSAAKRYGLFDRKGSIEIGKDADLALIDLGGSWTVRGEDFLSKGRITPFEGWEFRGRIVKTILRGKTIFDADRGISVDPGLGEHLTRR
ncbi:amidohydrolase family protein [bacterium]|nr:amidohydrolase family protein [bacterium]